jgi:hypothetical protein
VADHLARLGARPIASQANFVAFRHEKAGLIRAALDSLGVAVRGFAGREGLSDLLRVTMPGNPADADRLTRALQAAIRPRAVIVPDDARDCPDQFGSSAAAVSTIRAVAPLSTASIGDSLASSANPAAWAACRTVAEVYTARRAGVVPVGIAGADAHAEREAFAQAGVVATVESIARIKEVLP